MRVVAKTFAGENNTSLVNSGCEYVGKFRGFLKKEQFDNSALIINKLISDLENKFKLNNLRSLLENTVLKELRLLDNNIDILRRRSLPLKK